MSIKSFDFFQFDLYPLNDQIRAAVQVEEWAVGCASED